MTLDPRKTTNYAVVFQDLLVPKLLAMFVLAMERDLFTSTVDSLESVTCLSPVTIGAIP